jgi:hypothetical protein
MEYLHDTLNDTPKYSMIDATSRKAARSGEVEELA